MTLLNGLVVYVDRKARPGDRKRTLWRIGRRAHERGPNFLKRQPARRELRRIDLNANRRPLLTAERNLGDARQLRNLLGEKAVGIFVDHGNRQRVGARRQDKNRRIGRVELPVCRRRGHGLRQCLAGGGERRLHILRRQIDVPIEIELNRDRCRAERADRCQLGHAGNLADLTL